MEMFRKEIVRLLSEQLPLDKQQIANDLETPPTPDMGDFAFPCFKLAKELRNAPPKIAAELAEKLPASELLDRVEARGPYINFFCDRKMLAQLTLDEVQTEREKFGQRNSGSGQTVVIDFSAPNIAKPFGVGHLRSTVIGNSLYRIHEALGYKSVGINHLGDWGTQFGKLIVAYLKWGEDTRLEEDPITYLYELYVRFHREAEEKPALDEEARAWFKKLEDGDEQARQLWQRFRDLSLAEFKRIYNILGVHFDSYQGESYYNEMLDDTVRQVEAKDLTEVSEGALIVNLEDSNMPPCLLRKQDGATLYATRDLCAAIYRHQMHDFSKMLYVVGADQALHFQQVFAVLKKLGYEWADNCTHVPFGLIRFKEGKMSTRQGTLIFLEDVLNRATELAHQIIQEKNPQLENKDEVAKKVGIGAVIFGDLSNDRVKNIEFDWDKVLDFSGETAPYIQYSHARICSILRKAATWPAPFDATLLVSDEEQLVLGTIARFSDAIARAADTLKPSVLARYLLDLAAAFNRFYHQCPVLNAEDDIRNARLALIDAVRQVLVNGLYLLGIEAPEEM
ncbi:arginine--tRNA ligase [Dethiobacter alkaliphilus]|uniref:arginine--tRNA ligase n=1 Tax=Dethiobacter alkaliphilus TaxID=427926 RepID=UPI002226EED9|nr:arginine--tRNA ligase [Dethiobacter alkaliphilus]MCW3489004.1 arginine--tRNA ligase [Dethiobacter alkaliphilus]